MWSKSKRTAIAAWIVVVAWFASSDSGRVLAVESIHFGYNASYLDLTNAIRLSPHIGTAYWSQNRQNYSPENGAAIPYAYHDGYIEDLGTAAIPTASAMAIRWRQIMTGQGDSRTGVSGAAIGTPDLIILDELNSNFQDSNRGPLFREALRLYTLPIAQGGQGGSRNDIVAYVQPGLSQGTGVTNGLYDDVIFAANNYLRGLALEVYATEDGYRTGIESATNPTVYPTGAAYLGVRLTGPMRNWMNRGLSPTRLKPIINVSNIADTDIGGDFNAFLNQEFWFMANGRYSATSSQIDANIKTAFRSGVGTYTWAPDADNSNDPYQLLTRHTTRDAWFTSLFRWYVINGNTTLYSAPTGDFDLNGVVDTGDYAIWRQSYGQAGSGLLADADRNNRVDAADYILWRNHLGESAFLLNGASVSASVPESPTTLLVTWCAFAVAAKARRRWVACSRREAA